MPRVKAINHIAMVVADLESSLSFWRDGLGLDVRDLEDVPAENSRIAFLPLGDSDLELVLPTAADSGTAKFLARHGPGMHHVCLEVDDLEAMLTQLKARGVHLINEEARTSAAGVKYAFVHPDSTGGVLVELYQA